jgi:hypothetical protein
MLQEDISLASVWHGNARPGFSPDEAYQGPRGLGAKNISRKVAPRINTKLFPDSSSFEFEVLTSGTPAGSVLLFALSFLL